MEIDAVFRNDFDFAGVRRHLAELHLRYAPQLVHSAESVVVAGGLEQEAFLRSQLCSDPALDGESNDWDAVDAFPHDTTQPFCLFVLTGSLSSVFAHLLVKYVQTAR